MTKVMVDFVRVAASARAVRDQHSQIFQRPIDNLSPTLITHKFSASTVL